MPIICLNCNKESPHCHFCAVDATYTKGVIYIRYLVNDKWDNVPICKDCWDLERFRR